MNIRKYKTAIVRIVSPVTKCLRIIRHTFIKDKTITIISNNCIAADIYGLCDLRFNSPTVNLQILPSEYIKFCLKLDYYLNADVIRYTDLSDSHRNLVKKHYNRFPEELEFPFAICDDILICLQHYKSFDEFKDCWDRRKKRVNFNNLRKVFVVDNNYLNEAYEFKKIMSAKDALFTLNFKIENSFSIMVPTDTHFMEYMSLTRKYYQQSFHLLKWLNC